MKNHPLPSCAACEYLSLWFILPWLLLIYSITDQAIIIERPWCARRWAHLYNVRDSWGFGFSFLMFKFYFLVFWLCHAACEFQFPDQGSNLCPLHWKHGLLTL